MKKYFWLIITVLLLNACQKDKSSDPPEVLPDGLGKGIPLIIIDTDGLGIPNDPKISAKLEIKFNSQIVLYTDIGIEKRGSTSQSGFPKKSYGLELKNMTGMDTSFAILDLPAEEDWILYGPYSDKTLIRNVLAYQLSNAVQTYAPRTKLVELQINDSYKGVYVFMEKLKRDNNRIDIKSLDPEDIDPDNVSGGYILKIDKTSGEEGGDAAYTETLGFRSDYNTQGVVINYPAYGDKQSEETYLLYEYPKAESINAVQRNYINEYINDFEDALIAEDFSTSNRAYFNYIDISSFVDHFLLNELANNPDAYRISTYLFKDKNKALNFGPIWDFNLAYGNDSRSATNEWAYQYNERVSDDLWLVHFWWKKMLQDPLVRGQIKQRWISLRSNQLSNQNILSYIDDHVALLENDKGIERNYNIWDVINELLPFNSQVAGSYQGEIDYMKTWIEDRTAWMDGEIGDW